MSDCEIGTHQKYFVNFSILELDDITELKLTVNAKVEASISFKDQIYKSFIATVGGSEVSSSPFVGVLSDVFVLNFSWEIFHQENFYNKYFDFEDGDRCIQVKNDQKVHKYIVYDHQKTGHPTRLLSNYKYDHTFKEALRHGVDLNQQEIQHQQETQQQQTTMQDTTNVSTSMQASMITPSQMKRSEDAEYKANVEDFIQHVMNTIPSFYEKLKVVYVSRKWIFRSFYLYSPVILGPGVSKLNFKCLHNELASNPKEGYQYPMFPIQSSFFFKILDMVVEFTIEEKKMIEDICERCNALKYDSKYYQYFLYDKFLHYICTSDYIRPPKTKEELEQEEREKEMERRRLEEAKLEPSVSPEEEMNEAEEEQEDNTPVTDFDQNFYIGMTHKKYMTAEFEAFKWNMWRYGQDAVENFKLYSVHFVHTEDKYESITFKYLTKPKKSITWEAVYEYMEGIDDIFHEKLEYAETFKFVDYTCQLIPQRRKDDGEFDDEDALEMFDEKTKKTKVSFNIADIEHMKIKEAGGIFYSLRVDLKNGKRIRIEFNKPDIQDELGKQIDGLRYHFRGSNSEFQPRFGMAVIDRQRRFIGFGIFDGINPAIDQLVPELNQEVPIHQFGDVLHHFGNQEKGEDEVDKVDKLMFKYDDDRMLEIKIMGQRKETVHDPWPLKSETVDISDENRAQHLFDISFYHPIIVKKMDNERKLKELEAQKAKEKSKKSKKKKSKRSKKDRKKDDGANDKAAEPIKEVRTREFEVSNIAFIRVDYYFGRVCKILITYHDESSDVIVLPKRKPGETVQTEGGEEMTENLPTDNLNLDTNREQGEEVKEFEQKLYRIENGELAGLYARYAGELSDIVLWGAEEVIEKVEEEEKDPNEDEKAENQMQDEEEDQQERIDFIDKDSDYMDSMIDLDDIETRLIFCITYYIHVNRPPPANTKFNPEHLEKVNQKKFVKEKYNSAFRRVAEHIKRIIPKADIYANHEKASQVGEFTVYSYGLGNPDKDIFFTNVDRKQAFPSLSTLYYIIIGILINYDDFGLLQRKQEQYIQEMGIDFSSGRKYGEDYDY